MNQLNFLNSAPIAAASDPATSHLAAAELTRSGKRDSQKRAVLAILRICATPKTSAELACVAELDRHLVARRLPDLERDGQVERCEARACTISGRPAVTWRAR